MHCALCVQCTKRFVEQIKTKIKLRSILFSIFFPLCVKYISCKNSAKIITQFFFLFQLLPSTGVTTASEPA